VPAVGASGSSNHRRPAPPALSVAAATEPAGRRRSRWRSLSRPHPSAGAALAAWGAGVARDAIGDYAVAFYAAGVLAILAGWMALLIKRTPAPPAVPVQALSA
jgi:predicted MFS family arabinose efflux permease